MPPLFLELPKYNINIDDFIDKKNLFLLQKCAWDNKLYFEIAQSKVLRQQMWENYQHQIKLSNL